MIFTNSLDIVQYIHRHGVDVGLFVDDDVSGISTEELYVNTVNSFER